MKTFILVMLLFIGLLLPVNVIVNAEEEQSKPKVNVDASNSKYSLEVTISDIPKDRQTLFIPIKIDTTVLDFDKVALGGIATQNILAVASNSKDKVGTGIGLLKMDEKGLPPNLTLKVLLKQVGQGQTSVSLLQVADEPALLSKGAVINRGIIVSIAGNEDLEVSEKVEKNKKKLALNKNRITLNVKRGAQQEETIFIPLVFDKKLLDLEETFGHSVVAQGISAKAFSANSLNSDGPGVEILLTADAEKDFSLDVDLIPKGIGKPRLVTAYPQKGHTDIIIGAAVNINPSVITVANHNAAQVK